MKPGKLKFYINSIDLQNHKRTEAILHRLVTQYLCDSQQSYKHRYELQNFNSKEIERMLTMFENSRSGIRKLSLVLISLVLMNSQSKIFFLEKCGLSLVTGKTFLTRLKYVSNFSSSMSVAFRHMRAIMAELKQTPVLSSEVLFWHIPLEIHNRTISDMFLPRVKTFRISNIKVVGDVVDLSQLPDPVFHLCGVEFSALDQRAKIVAIKKPGNQPFSYSAISHTRKSNRVSQPEQKQGVPEFLQNSTRSSILKPKRDYSKPRRAQQPMKKNIRYSMINNRESKGRPRSKTKTGWKSHRKNNFENKSGIPVKQEARARQRDVRRYSGMGQVGGYFPKGNKAPKKNGSQKSKGRYSQIKRKGYPANEGPISSMHEVVGSGNNMQPPQTFGSKVYKKKGRSTFTNSSIKNSRKSAKH